MQPDIHSHTLLLFSILLSYRIVVVVVGVAIDTELSRVYVCALSAICVFVVVRRFVQIRFSAYANYDVQPLDHATLHSPKFIRCSRKMNDDVCLVWRHAFRVIYIFGNKNWKRNEFCICNAGALAKSENEFMDLALFGSTIWICTFWRRKIKIILQRCWVEFIRSCILGREFVFIETCHHQSHDDIWCDATIHNNHELCGAHHTYTYTYDNLFLGRRSFHFCIRIADVWSTHNGISASKEWKI